MPRRYYSSTAARTTLSASVNSSVTSLTVVAVSGWPSSFPYTLIIDQDTVNEEIVEVTNRSGTTLTVVRGVDGTTAVAHSAGAAVNHGVSARDFDEPNAFLNGGGTLNGPTVVDVNSSSTALRVTQTGSGNALLIEDSASPDSTPFVVDANGFLVQGATVGQTGLGYQQAVEIFGQSGTLGQYRHTADTAGVETVWFKNRSTTVGSHTIVANGDSLGILRAAGSDGVNFVEAARISAAVDGTPGTGDMPGRLVFSTTADGASTPTERMRITSTGNVGIGTSSPAGALHIERATSFHPQVYIDNTNTDPHGGYVFLRKRPSDNVIEANNTIGSFAWRGVNTSGADVSIGSIVVQADAANNATGVPARMNFGVANSSGTETERMRIDNAGLITGTGTSLGAWTAYTPTLGGTGWAIGNGTIEGAYCQIGKLVVFRINCAFGSTSTFGAAAAPTLTVPVTGKNASTAAQSSSAISVQYRDTSASNRYLGNTLGGTASFTLLTIGAAGLTGAVLSTAPFTWADTDQILVQGYYEAA